MDILFYLLLGAVPGALIGASLADYQHARDLARLMDQDMGAA